MATPATGPASLPAPLPDKYKAFISYSHTADRKFAPALQSALEKFAKSWYSRRAIRVFRDQTDLSVSPEAWPSIERALAASEYLLLLASPEGANSKWVAREVEFWLHNKSPDSLLLILTRGEIVWNHDTNDFDREKSTAISPALLGQFATEPLYCDLRWAQKDELATLPADEYRDAIGTVAATLHGVEKSAIVGKDLQEHRKRLRLAWTTSVALAVLLIASVVAGIVAYRQYRSALAGRLRAESRVLRNRATTLERSVLFAIEGARMQPTAESIADVRDSTVLLSTPVLTIRYPAKVIAVAINPAGDRFMTGTDEGDFQLLDTKTGKWLTRLTKASPVAALAFSHNGEYGAVGYAGEASIFPGRGNWAVGFTETRHQDLVHAVAFSRDERQVASASLDGTVALLNLATRKRLTLKHGDAVYAVSFSNDGTQVATGSRDGSARLFVTATGQELGRWTHKGWVMDVSFSSDGHYVASASRDSTVRVYDVSRRKEVLSLPHEGEVWSVAFRPGLDVLATGSEGRAQVFEVRGGKELLRPEHEDIVNEVAYTRDGKRLVTASTDGAARVFDADTGRLLKGMQEGGKINGFSLSADGNRIATASSDQTARIYDFNTGETRVAVPPFVQRGPVGFSFDGKWLVMQTDAGTVQVIEAVSGKAKASLPVKARATALAISPDGRLLAMGLADRQFRLVNLQNGADIRSFELKDTLMSIQFSEDGRLIGLGGWNGSSSGLMGILDGASGNELLAGIVRREVRSVAIHGQKHWLAAGMWDGAIWVFDQNAKENKAVRKLQHGAKPVNMAFSQDGDLLAVASGNITVYHLPSTSIHSLIHVNMPVSHMRFSPDKKRLEVIIEADRDFVRTSNALELTDVIEAACSHLTRNLTEEEWDRYMGLERYRQTCPAFTALQIEAKRPRGLLARPGDDSDDDQ
jgi:WD40 repeat protein